MNAPSSTPALAGTPVSILTICGLDELAGHGAGRVSHVLSILDPDWPDPEAFKAWDPHRRTILHFHDAIEPAPGIRLPTPEHVRAILAFGRSLAEDASRDASRDEREAGRDGHLLVHCHAGISRSTAAMAMMMAQAEPDAAEDDLVARLHAIREKAWPNLLMIEMADERLGRGGRLTAAVARLYRRQLAVRPQLAEFMRGLNRGREVSLGGAA